MKILFIIFAFISCAFANPIEGIQERVVGGSTADITQHYYQASILLNGQHICGGVILNSFSILSAAHCFQLNSNSLRQYLVKVGSIHIDQGTIYPIFQIKIHERFVNYEYDLAMVTLRVPIKFDIFANLVALERLDAFVPGKTGVATGWSSQARNQTVLQQVNLANIQQPLCRQLYAGFTPITDNMFCAGDINGDIGACTGSFGGPIVLNRKLIGISAFSNGCAQLGYPTVFTKIFGLLNWIDTAAKIRPTF